MKKYIILLGLLTVFPAFAQTIEIDADDRVEWYRDEQKMIAVGNAVAQKENNTLKGDVLTAFYEQVQLEDGSRKTQLQKVISEGIVTLKTPDTKGTGNYFDYYLPTQTAVLTGNPAKIENQTGQITAEKSITYYGAENKSVALGNVIAKNQDYTVYADKMVSFFDEDKQGKKTLNRVEIYASGRPVKIVNAQATVTGKRGTYFPVENKLKMFDDVEINQNGNILKGDYAETDLKTGISSLKATQTKGRVSGVFHNKKK